jgi:hypothetical protein
MQKILHFGGLDPNYLHFDKFDPKLWHSVVSNPKYFAFSSTFFCISTLLIKIPWVLLGSLSSGHAGSLPVTCIRPSIVICVRHST